ncbi:MAG: indolepyruvate ferredoxin oxidoreductase family protein [Alphaproteobacteria bacterium]
MAQTAVSLDDKYALETGRVFLTGVQALVRLPLMQRQRDDAAGLKTGGYITGYRGSPLGALDQQLWQARPFIEKNHIRFEPGVNEDLAATAVWGSQQLNLFPDANYDGVFAMWYAKGPGVDRSGDALRHGNLAGSSKHGGVLLLSGDDHTCKSSTTAHQTEYAYMDAMIPVLNPSGVQEFLDMGLYGWAMSRYSGCWVAFKVIAETADSSASVHVDPHRVKIRYPDDFDMPADGLNIRYPDEPLAQEERLHRHKLYAALAFARANNLNRTVIDGPKRRFGIVTAGKSYLDVMQALEDLGIDEAYAQNIGLSVYKVGMTWPLEPEGIRRFAEGLEEILVVEEKRALIENQLKEQLYNWREDARPRVIGKFDEERHWILPSNGELTPGPIAKLIAKRIARFHTSGKIEERVRFLDIREQSLAAIDPPLKRTPYFCSGCPHNTSTKVPEGSRALAGIGCHYMAQWMDRNTETYTQMGGEGASWHGQAPFTGTKHVFVNLGDGTYYHSGLLAIRAAVAAGNNITYKILFNDAVAMTGGQPVGGGISVPRITHQLYGEGVGRVVVVSDEPEKYGRQSGLAAGVTIEHRDELDRIQRELREVEGVTAIIYDQTCAAEKRRRRKRGTFPDPARRVIINELVCEGCGDCSVASNCLSVVPKETEFGRKRSIDQSTCNKDFSCLNGFCPSFVTVEGGALRKPEPAAQTAQPDLFEVLPEPAQPSIDTPYGILITGVGGTGVVTIGALLGMAAHIEGKGCSVLDMTGLAQKGGAVLTHVRIARTPEDIHAVRLASGGAKAVIGCDIVVTAGSDVLTKVRPGETAMFVNTHETITGDFTRDPDMAFPEGELERGIAEMAGKEKTDFVEATRLATALLGDSIATNMFMLGYAWQKGTIPIAAESIETAIELNGVAVKANKAAFLWGQRAAHDPAAVQRAAGPAAEKPEAFATTLEDVVRRRIEFLTGYQDAAYARRYKDLVVRVQTAESRIMRDSDALTQAVARYYFKLLAYKDEYEVARLHTDPAFLQSVRDRFTGDYRLNYHLAPPLTAERDPETGHLRKKAYGPWMLQAFRLLAKLKGIRGTAWDPFGRSAERRRERELIIEYEAAIAEILAGLTVANHAIAVEIASVPEHIRGYGHVKDRHIADAKANEAALFARFRDGDGQANAAD